MGVNGAHNTVGKMSTPTTLFGLCCAKEVAEYYFCRCTGYGPWYRGLTCALCLAFSVRSGRIVWAVFVSGHACMFLVETKFVNQGIIA